jgi:tetratricopeptide (TPR) repeat protein
MADRVPTVFLSSTAKDLTAFRDAIHARLTDGGKFKCIRQEDLTGPETVAFCSREAARADFFVGLIGMRRGWEPDGDANHRSITEIEYDCAKPNGRFIYVTPDNFPVPGYLHETDEQHQRQLKFRERVKTRIAPRVDFSTPELLAHIVIEHLLTHLYARYDGDDHQKLSDAVLAKLLAALDARGEVAKAASGGLERDIIVRLAKRLKPDEVLDFDQTVAALENAVGIALDSVARGQRGTNEDDFINTVLERVAEQTKAGEFDRATNEVDAALVELDQRETAQRDALQRSRVALLEAGIQQDILRRDAPAVARRVERIATTEEPDDSAQRFRALRRRQNIFYVEGRDKGLNFSLEIAIQIAWLTVNCAQHSDERGEALNDLGISLATLGERESGTERLEEAVAAYHDALREHTRDRVPLDWAMTQNNLGNALQTLGEREGGNERLEEALVAYRNALTEYTRERIPLQWAATQNNLGNALRTLGERESGTARLEEAVAVYRDAMKEFTRERVPIQWATTQNNLGNALQNLGERESGTARLEQAAAAYRDALKERTRERVPLEWAMTQNNLGNALLALGVREQGTIRLQDAVIAYRSALKERTRERVPLQWAATQNNLGTVLAGLSERDQLEPHLQEAIACYRAALLEWTIDRVPLDWAMVQNNLANALISLGEISRRSAHLEEARECLSKALSVFEQAGALHYARAAHRNLVKANSSPAWASTNSDETSSSRPIGVESL